MPSILRPVLRPALSPVLRKTLTPIKGVGYLDAFMSAQAARLYLDTTLLATTWQDTSATTPADDVSEAIGRIDDKLTRTSSPNNATQGTASLKPTRQTTGAKFDGSDDNWLTTYLNGAAGNFIVALVSVPASLSALQIVAGARASAASRFLLGFESTFGVLVAGVGATAVGSGGLAGSTNRRGTEVVVGLSCNGSIVRLFDDNTQVIETAQSGSVDTTVPYRIGCFNDNGSASSFFGGSVKKLVAGRELLALDRYLQIRNALINS